MTTWFLQIGGSWNTHGSLEFCSLDWGWVIEPSCFCLLDAIVGLRVVDEKTLNDFLIRNWKWILYVIVYYLVQSLYFDYVVEAFITLHSKAQHKHMSPFSSLLLVCVHFFFFINFSYIRVYFHSDPHTSFRLPMKSPPPGGGPMYSIWESTQIHLW
jgi:hypothetical protein